VSIINTLYHKYGFFQEKVELQKKEEIPYQNVDHFGQKDCDNGNELVKPSINGKFNNCSEKKKIV
jgi:hypothetical protein